MRSGLAVYGTLAFMLMALLAVMPQAALALTASQVYEQVKDSVVVVKAFDKQGKQVGQGSGVMLPSGDVITNYHVVKAGVRYTVGRGKKGVPATVKAGDPKKDLCLLAAPGLRAQPARLGKAARLKVGEPVYAVGAPQGLELSLSEGIVSQLRGGPPPIIQTTVAISPGSSGGGLFNADGELVGITTSYLKDSQSLNFAVPVEWIGQIKSEWVVASVEPLPSASPKADKAPGSPEPGARPKECWGDRWNALVKAQDWPGLLACCRRWIKTEPENDVAWFGLGLAYGRLGRYRDGIAAYREALRLKPDYAMTWYNLGTAYANLGRYREAIEAYREAMRLKPDYHEAWNNLGFAYGKLGRHGEAIKAYREALRLKPDYADAWNNLAAAYALSGNRSAALEALKELRRYDPQQAEKLFNLIMKP
jgi:regulator of sirC expression with transglutaminase-like and TPR domain